jgi:phosphate starvation-inducible protein PhoH and related proteins
MSLQKNLSFDSQEDIRILFGCRDQNLKMLRTRLGVNVVVRGDELRITGDEPQVETGLKVFSDLQSVVRLHKALPQSEMERILERHLETTHHGGGSANGGENGSGTGHSGTGHSATVAIAGRVPGRISRSDSQSKRGRDKPRHGDRFRNGDSEQNTEFRRRDGSTDAGQPVRRAPIELFDRARAVIPRTAGQQRYIDAIERNDLTFCVGPAGCGKTYLAVAMALNALRTEQVRKIVLVRPAVEAGEKLGFLPGDMLAKVNPYLRPLLDALADILSFEQVRRYIENDVVEIIPLGFMRGRTLNDTFIILDEAQNTTVTQMKMLLTRMGEHSRIVVTGDATQSDLPAGQTTGLLDAVRRLKNIAGVEAVELSGQDIVRHRLVREIVKAYDDENGQSPGTQSRRKQERS